MNKTTILICTLAALLCSGLQNANAVDLGKIMPMGDSITEGYFEFGMSGYRLPLYNKLTARGETFQFVGSNTSFPSSLPSNQTHHEGHSGYIIQGGPGAPRTGLDENLVNWIGPGKATPDKILLMIGTNDIDNYYDMANAPARLDHLISDIYGYLPNVDLYVASIVLNADQQSDVQAFNATLPSIVADHKAHGQDVFFVPMYDALTLADMSDSLHPNAVGYEKMAQVWDTALNPVPEPGTVVSLVMAGLALLAFGWRGRK